MKTHIPTKLRKALIAALFAVSSVAYNAQAGEVVQVSNSHYGYADTRAGFATFGSQGYSDLTFSGTNEKVGHTTHYCHDYTTIAIPQIADVLGDEYDIRAEVNAGGIFEVYSITSMAGKSDYVDYSGHHNHDLEEEFGYSPNVSDGNISITNGARVHVTTTITANNSLAVNSNGELVADTVTAGSLTADRGSVTSKVITVASHELLNPEKSSDGILRVSNGAVVTAQDQISAKEVVVDGSTVNASNIKVADAIYGSSGVIKGLPDSDLTVSGKILTENAKYLASSGYAVKVETIGDIYNAGTVAEPDWTVRGNNNHFGYNEDGTSVLASRVEVKGNVVSDGNKIAATGSNLVSGTPAISITGTVGRTDEPTGPAKGNELYAMKGDISVGTLADNTNLTILAEDGGVEIKNASTATIKDSSITAADDVVIAASETGSNAKLKLINTDVTSEDGDITANQVLVMEKGTLSAENGNVTAVGLNGKAASVHAINLEAGNIKLDADASSTADIVLTGDMTSTKGTMIINGYNGDKPRVTVDGTQKAQKAIDITSSNVAVGEDQKSEAGDISVAGSTLTVGGNQEAAKTIGVYSSTVDIAGDEKAGTRLGVHGSTLTVGGDQTAGTSMAIDSGSKVTVGHEDEETGELVGGNQKAKMNINIEDSDVTVLADQTSTDGSIVIRDLDDSQNPTIVKVEGNQKAKTGISATKAGLTVGIIEEIEDELTGEKTYELSGGNQTAETGDISLTNSTADILGHQEAVAGNIIVAGSTLTVGAKTTDGKIVQASNQTAQNDIAISDSNVTVLGNETAGNHISVTDSIVTVDGDQTATNGSITIKSTGTDGATPSKVTIGGDQKAGIQIKVVDSTLTVGTIETIEDEETGEITYELHGGNQTADSDDIVISGSKVAVLGDQTATEGNIDISKGSELVVGAIAEDGEIVQESNQTAKQDITISDSNVRVLGDQTATEGNISIIDKDAEKNPTVVLVEGNQKAGNGISVDDSTLTVGTIEETTTPWGWPVYSLSGGNQTAETGDITISHSDVNVLGDQTAETGAISVTKGSDLTVGCLDPNGILLHAGNQTAETDITITDSDVHVLGDQTATTGKIAIISTGAEGTTPSVVTVDGNQTAGNGISETGGSTLTVGVVREFTDMWGNTHYWLTGGNQTAENGNISIDGSAANILGHQEATEGSIYVANGSTLKVGALDPNDEVVQASNQTAKQDIKITDSLVTVLGDQEATEGEIVISANPEGNMSLVYVGGDQTAGTDITLTTAFTAVKGDQTAGGSIAATDTMTLVNGDQTAADDITVIDSIMFVDGDQTATAGAIAISSTGAEDMTPSEVTINGDQTAGTDISVTDSTLKVGSIETIEDEETGEITYELHGGNQTAEMGNIMLQDSTVDVLGHQKALDGTISVIDSTLTVGAVDPNGKVIQASNQTAHQDIEIVNSEVTVLGDQIAEQGRIAIQSIGEDVTTPSEVIIGGDQTAYTNIYVADSTLTVGTIETIEDEATGEITYELRGGNQTADTRDIGLANSTVEILGHQKATEASISVFNSTLTVGAVDPNGEVLQASNQTAKQNIVIVDSEVNVLGDQTAETGAIAISSSPETGITSVVSVGGNQKAGNGIFVTASELTVGTAELVTDETTGEQHVVLTGGNQTADQDDIIISNSTVKVLADQTAVEGGIKIDKLSLVTIGTVDVDGTVLAGNQLAKKDIEIDSSTLMVMDNQTSQEGSISVQALDDFSLVMVGGSQTAKKDIGIFGSKEHEKPTTVLVGEDQIAGEGNIAINDAQVSVNGKVVALGDGTDGTGIVALAGATYDVGVSLQAKELNIGTIDNPSAVTINVESLDADGNPLDTVLDVDKLTVAEGNTLHTGNVKMDETDVTIKGAVEVGVKDADPEKAIAANWDTEGTHLISGEGASLKANGNIRIAAAEGDTVTVDNGATVAATGNVTIQGLADALAVVDTARVRGNGDVTFTNAVLSNDGENIKSTDGNIVLKERVEISDTKLSIEPTDPAKAGSIVVEAAADVQLYQGTVDVFNGKLAGTGSVAANDENLLLYKDASAFNGNINMNRGGDQTLLITNGTGVGANATLALHNGADLETINTTGEMQQPQLGNVVATGAGSDITLNGGVAGDTARATSLSLTDGTTLNVDSTQGEAGLVADSIVGTQKIDAQGARVAVHSTTDMEITPDGTRHTVVGLAEGGTIASGFNEDVLYDLNGVQRTLQTRNMHLEHTAHGVDLVLSENYKGIDNRNTNAVAVRDVILPLDAAADHRPGVLAGSASQLDHVLDALDYTRSGADAREGLLSLSGAANLIVPNMMMDASRHHLSALRDHMSAPVCTDNRKTKGNVWAAYTGGYDHIGGDENMHAYSHSYQGALVGGDYAVNCNWAVGLSLGYQKSIARTDATRADADAISGDLYAVGRTGKYTHRFSMGLTSYSTDVKRGTRIAAAGHTYHGQSTGSADGMSWNFGYQLSRNFAINEVSSITPYMTVDVALQRIDTLNEKGQGDASVVTDYEDFVQTDAALGVAYSHTFASFNRQTGVFSVNLAAHGEFSEHRATAKNHFAGYADTWKTRSMKRAPFYGELGADVVVPFGEHLSGTAGMNFEFSADRTFVGGHAGVNYRF